MPDTPVVVLTALEVEYRAVRAQLNDIEQQRHSSGTLFDVGKPRCGGPKVALGLTGVGNTSAAVIAERAITQFRPQAVLFVGVAGALRTDIPLGDVVVGTKIYAYHGGLEQDSGFFARPRAWEPNHRLEQLARYIARTAGGNVHFGPIAAGEVVLNSRQSPLVDQLRRNYNDAVAIEMESAGTALAGHLNEMPFLAIRGVSDRADGSKYDTDGDGWQPVAAYNAAQFALALVSELNEAPSPQPQTHDGLDWRALEHPVDVEWRLDRRRRMSTFEATALELHLVGVEAGPRIEVRRLATLPDELVALGRDHQLFTTVEQLRPDAGSDRAIVEAMDHRRGPAGLAVLRSGQTSVWEPLPRDSLGSVLDPDDVASQIERLLGLHTAIDVPRSERIAIAIAVEPAMSVSIGTVSALPRHQAGFSMKELVQIQPDESLPYKQILSHRKDVAEELAARLLAEFRA